MQLEQGLLKLHRVVEASPNIYIVFRNHSINNRVHSSELVRE